MGVSISAAGAFLGGAVSLLSPCAAMVLPAFFAYAYASKRQVVLRSLIFFCGLLTTLLPLGVFAGSLGYWLSRYQHSFLRAMALIVIFFGILQIFAISFPNFGGFFRRFRAVFSPSNSIVKLDPQQVAKTHRAWQAMNKQSANKLEGSRVKNLNLALPTVEFQERVSPLGVYCLGAAFGLTSMCAGPILGSVIVVAAQYGQPVRGAWLLALYAAGMAFPAFLLAILWDFLRLGERSWLKPRVLHLGKRKTTITNLISGLLFVGLGIALLCGVEKFPGFQGISAGAQIDLEARLLDSTATIPDWVLGFLLLGIVCLGILVVLRNRLAAKRHAINEKTNN